MNAPYNPNNLRKAARYGLLADLAGIKHDSAKKWFNREKWDVMDELHCRAFLCTHGWKFAFSDDPDTFPGSPAIADAHELGAIPKDS